MMGDIFNSFVNAIVVISVVCVLADFVPGLVLRAINDFKLRYGGGNCGEKKMEKGAVEQKPEEKR